MEAKTQEKFKWTMMESDECNTIGSTKRRKRWKQQQQQCQLPLEKMINKHINDKNENHNKNIEKILTSTCRKVSSKNKHHSSGNSNNNNDVVTYKWQQQQQQQKHEKNAFNKYDDNKSVLVSLLLKKCHINWQSCFCYLSWSNFRWLTVISASMKTIVTQNKQQQHNDKNDIKATTMRETNGRKESKQKHHNYRAFVKSSVDLAQSSYKSNKIITTITTTTTPTIKETLSSTSSPARIEVKTTMRNLSSWRQKLPIFPWAKTSHSHFYHLLLLLLLILNILQHHHAAAYGVLIPPPKHVNSTSQESLVPLKHDHSLENLKNEDDSLMMVGTVEGVGETLVKLDNRTFKSYSIIDGNSLALETLENTLLGVASNDEAELDEQRRRFPHSSQQQQVEPIFDFGMPRNITARTGQGEAIIKCRVEELHDKSVSWIRKRDLHILSVGTATYTSDKRFEVTGSKDQREWSLHVKAPQTRDNGIYECQINTEPKISMAFQLNIIEISPDAKAVINGPADLYFKVGSAIILSCVVQQPSIKDIGPIYWYRGDHMITPFERDETLSGVAGSDGDLDGFDSNANEVLEIGPTRSISNAAPEDRKLVVEHQSTANEITHDFTTRIAMESQLGDTLKSRLRISNAQTTDTGNYTCQPTTASSASVLVHVINDENPAAMQKSAAVALHRTPVSLCSTITAMVVIQVMLMLLLQNCVQQQQHFLSIIITAEAAETLEMKRVARTKVRVKTKQQQKMCLGR